MNYRLQCLTPLLVGDGSNLSPIDYMVWKNQVNVLDQRRIFRLLAKGPRLDSYLSQVKRAEKLDFASWGGFAQNFAGRRIAFEFPGYSIYWSRLRAEHCHIPTFASGPSGPYLPGSAVRGALRTAVMASRATGKSLALLEQIEGDRPSRRLGDVAERQVMGKSGHDCLKAISIADSAPAAAASFQIYLVRTATLVQSRAGGGKLTLAWKQSPRGSVDAARVEESTPQFVEMAMPGTIFAGTCSCRWFYQQPEIARSLHWRETLDWSGVLKASNEYAGRLLHAHQQFAEWTGLPLLMRSINELRQRLEQAVLRGNACMLSMGWGAGFLGKTAWPDTENEQYRRILARQSYYSKAVRSGLPFPKTRQVVFLGNQAAALAGWAWLEIM